MMSLRTQKAFPMGTQFNALPVDDDIPSESVGLDSTRVIEIVNIQPKGQFNEKEKSTVLAGEVSTISNKYLVEGDSSVKSDE